MVSNESVKDIFRQQTLREPKLAQLDNTRKVNSNCSKGKPMSGSAVIGKAKCFLQLNEHNRQARSLEWLAVKF
jgi:hypothetical protein